MSYDGIDVTHIHKDDLRASLGIVLQDTHLFTGTVMDNIRYGRLDATDEECAPPPSWPTPMSSSKHLPDGYNTMLTGDGQPEPGPAPAACHCPCRCCGPAGTDPGRSNLQH